MSGVVASIPALGEAETTQKRVKNTLNRNSNKPP